MYILKSICILYPQMSKSGYKLLQSMAAAQLCLNLAWLSKLSGRHFVSLLSRSQHHCSHLASYNSVSLCKASERGRTQCTAVMAYARLTQLLQKLLLAVLAYVCMHSRLIYWEENESSIESIIELWYIIYIRLKKGK